ncbi:MAG: winged helix-turn-helix transcriptional regulator [Myxococcales bacterium]|nr:winged helix-turn-helix transcriptional regulator [Myxococcales bacterium]
MTRVSSDPRDDYFDTHSDSVADRVAVALAKVGLAMKNAQLAQAQEGGLSATQQQILAILAARGAQRPSAIAQRLGVTAATVSDSIKSLCEKGLAERDRDPDDARAQRVALTPKGRRRAESAMGWPDFLVGAIDKLSADKQEAFLAGLIELIATLQREDKVPQSAMCVSCVYFQPWRHGAEAASPHHCGLVDAPMAHRHLRVECPEHERAADEDASRALEQLRDGARSKPKRSDL